MKRSSNLSATMVLVTFVVCLLASCGGGGGGGSTSPTSSAPTINASIYAGDYVGTCLPMANSSNYETDSKLYVKTILSVGAGSGATAPLVSRLDFFDDPSCSGQALGTLPNRNASNTLSLISATTVGGRVAHKVTLQFGDAMASYQAGPTSDTVIYGTALRLKLPRALITGFTARDLWALDNNALYEGTTNYGPDGFPLALAATPVDTKVDTVPSLPEVPCAAITRGWSENSNYCRGETKPSASQVSQKVDSNWNLMAGSADFVCTNGSWSAAIAPKCQPMMCPAQTFTWTYSGLTCSGQSSATRAEQQLVVENSIVGLAGGQVMQCQADGSWSILRPGQCKVRETNPETLAQNKNCLACHRIRNPVNGNYPFASFQNIANYYRANPPAPGVLEQKVKSGSAGTFGEFPMPANSQVDDFDLAILIPWILAQP